MGSGNLQLQPFHFGAKSGFQGRAEVKNFRALGFRAELLCQHLNLESSFQGNFDDVFFPSLHLAAKNGLVTEIAERLEEGADVNATDELGPVLFQGLACYGSALSV